MGFTYNGIEIENVTFNGTEVQTVVFNGTTIWEAIKEVISDGTAVNGGFSPTLIKDYCNYGAYSGGNGKYTSPNIFKVSMSDYYEASRYLLCEWLLNLGIVGKGQTITIRGTYHNVQMVSINNTHSSNYAKAHVYCHDTEGVVTDVSPVSLRIGDSGSNSFDLELPVPDDGRTYDIKLAISTWAGAPYSGNVTTVTITDLSIK